MKCRYCGCTDDRACVGGCHWVEKEVCSNCCVGSANAGREASAYLDDPAIKKAELLFTNKDGTTFKLLIVRSQKTKKKIIKRWNKKT